MFAFAHIFNHVTGKPECSIPCDSDDIAHAVGKYQQELALVVSKSKQVKVWYYGRIEISESEAKAMMNHQRNGKHI